MLRDQLADVNRALNNLMAAIEAGIFSVTTQTRLSELETQKRDLGRLITAAEAEAEKALTREEIIATLELFQHGDVTDKDYQEALIDTFLVAAYVYDDRVKFVFNLGGDKKTTEIPFDIDSIDPSGVRIDSGEGDHTFLYEPVVFRINARKGNQKSATALGVADFLCEWTFS